MKTKTRKPKPKRKIEACSKCGKPSEFFIANDGVSVHTLMTLESITWKCLACMLKWYFPRFVDNPGPGPRWIAHRV